MVINLVNIVNKTPEEIDNLNNMLIQQMMDADVSPRILKSGSISKEDTRLNGNTYGFTGVWEDDHLNVTQEEPELIERTIGESFTIDDEIHINAASALVSQFEHPEMFQDIDLDNVATLNTAMKNFSRWVIENSETSITIEKEGVQGSQIFSKTLAQFHKQARESKSDLYSHNSDARKYRLAPGIWHHHSSERNFEKLDGQPIDLQGSNSSLSLTIKFPEPGTYFVRINNNSPLFGSDQGHRFKLNVKYRLTVQ